MSKDSKSTIPGQSGKASIVPPRASSPKPPVAAKKQTFKLVWYDVASVAGPKVAQSVRADDTEGTVSAAPLQAGYCLVTVFGTGENARQRRCLLDTGSLMVWEVDQVTTRIHDASYTHGVSFSDNTELHCRLVDSEAVAFTAVDGTTKVTFQNQMAGVGHLLKAKKERGKTSFSKADRQVNGGMIGLGRQSTKDTLYHLVMSGNQRILGQPDNTKRVKALLDSIEETLGARIVSLHLVPYAHREEARVTMGGLDPAYKEEEFKWADIKSSAVYPDHWTYNQGIKYGDHVLTNSCSTMIDTGATFLTLPRRAFDKYKAEVMKTVPGLKKFADYGDEADVYLIPESEFPNLKSIHFSIKDGNFEITRDAQVWPKHFNAKEKVPKDYLLLAVTARADDWCIVGLSALTRLDIVLKKTQIGFKSNKYANAVVNAVDSAAASGDAGPSGTRKASSSPKGSPPPQNKPKAETSQG